MVVSQLRPPDPTHTHTHSHTHTQYMRAWTLVPILWWLQSQEAKFLLKSVFKIVSPFLRSQPEWELVLTRSARQRHVGPSTTSGLNNHLDWLKLKGVGLILPCFPSLPLVQRDIISVPSVLLPPWDGNWRRISSESNFFVSVSSDECRPLRLFLLLSTDSGSMALTHPHRGL